jgi:hypothetical protein
VWVAQIRFGLGWEDWLWSWLGRLGLVLVAQIGFGVD